MSEMRHLCRLRFAQRKQMHAIRRPGRSALELPPEGFLQQNQILSRHVGRHKHRFLQPMAAVFLQDFCDAVAKAVVFDVVTNDVMHI